MIRDLASFVVSTGALAIFLVSLVLSNAATCDAQSSEHDFTLDSTESYLTLSIPNFTFSTLSLNITGQNRMNGAPLTGAWTSGNKAFVSGSFSTTIAGPITPGGITSVQFTSGSSTLTGLTSGNYRPNPTAYNSTTQPPTYNNNSAAQAAYGGTVHTQFGNGGAFALSNAAVELSTSNPLTVAGNQFSVNLAGNPLVTGFGSLTMALQAFTIPIIEQVLPSVDVSLTGMAQADLSAANGTILVFPSGDLSMTIPVVVPFSMPVGGGIFLNGTATGQFVALSDPEPSSLLLALMGMGGLVAFRARARRRAGCLAPAKD